MKQGDSFGDSEGEKQVMVLLTVSTITDDQLLAKSITAEIINGGCAIIVKFMSL